MKHKFFKKKQKGMAARKTEMRNENTFPYKTVSMGVLLWLFTTWLFFSSGIVRHIDIGEGQHFSTTILAEIDFECENLAETALQRVKATREIPLVFSINLATTERATTIVTKLFERLQQLSNTQTNQQQVIINSVDDLLLGSSISAQELITAFPITTLSKTNTTLLVDALQTVMSAGIISDESKRSLFRNTPDRKLTIINEGASDKTVSQQDIYTVSSAKKMISKSVLTSPQRTLITQLLNTLVVDNLSYNETATDELRNDADERIEPVMQRYLAETTLVRAGDPATQQTLLLLQVHEQKRQDQQETFEQILEILGNSILLLAGLIAAAIILRIVSPKTLQHPDQILLLILLSLFTLISAKLLTILSVQYSLIPPSLLMYLVPHALAILLAAILLGGRQAICLGLWTSFATAVLFDQSFHVFSLGLLITVTATSTARNVHQRSSLFHAGLWVCAVKVLFVLVSAILNRPVASVLAGQIAVSILSGMLSTIFVLLLLPIFEKVFKITTDITLLELSDMGQPLLQKLAIQAPGTYHHSLMVATLSQTAAEAIGANPLLVRVCAYYHDIGKLAKPEFFAENIQHKENPHDELSPHMSSLVIVSHVKEGLSLAKRNKLPKPILEAIEQHHGNGLISYFYDKAKNLQKMDLNTSGTIEINESDFRYGGTPAVTPEMSILSLADASEAAVRSIEKPTPKKIENMINRVFSAKINDGQLDYTQLTMAQINTVKQSIIFSLTNMLHGRIPYPSKTNENTNTKSATETPTKSTSNPTTL